MTKKLQSQQEDLERSTALIEAERAKLCEMNALFTKTNDKLSEEMQEKDRLLCDLTALSGTLSPVALPLMPLLFATETKL